MSKLKKMRAATPSDIPFILRGERSYMESVEPENLASWNAAIDRNIELWHANLHRCVVVELEGRKAGYALWAPVGEAATLVTIHVVESARRKGLGAALMAWFAESAQASDCTDLRLAVHGRNPARGLYERSGYVRVGEHGDYLLYQRALRRVGDQPAGR